jgi:hypothetical protein
MVIRRRSNGEMSGSTPHRVLPILCWTRVEPGHGGCTREASSRQMVSVLVVGSNDVALRPVRRALASLSSAELVRPDAARSEVGAVVLEESLGAEQAAGRVEELAAAFPRASLVVIALEAGDRYRWLHIRRHPAGYNVCGAGTDPLGTLLRSALGSAEPANRSPAHGALAAMPCSTA